MQNVAHITSRHVSILTIINEFIALAENDLHCIIDLAHAVVVVKFKFKIVTTFAFIYLTSHSALYTREMNEKEIQIILKIKLELIFFLSSNVSHFFSQLDVCHEITFFSCALKNKLCH